MDETELDELIEFAARTEWWRMNDAQLRAIRCACVGRKRLSTWEKEFCLSLSQQRHHSTKQTAVLDRIEQEIQGAGVFENGGQTAKRGNSSDGRPDV